MSFFVLFYGVALARQMVDTCPKQIQNPHKCQGSWHSKRKLACQYCRAVAFLDPGESEDFLYTAFGHNAAHRSTYLIQPFLISSFWLEIPRKRSHNLKLLICSILTLLNGFTLPLWSHTGLLKMQLTGLQSTATCPFALSQASHHGETWSILHGI